MNVSVVQFNKWYRPLNKTWTISSVRPTGKSRVIIGALDIEYRTVTGFMGMACMEEEDLLQNYQLELPKYMENR